MLKFKLSMLCILITTVVFLQAPFAAGVDPQATINSLNSKLSQIQFTNHSPPYKDTGKSSYSFNLTSNNLVITFSEERSSYRNNVFVDRYVESGTLTVTTNALDVAKTVTRKNRKYNNDFRVNIGCKNDNQCIKKNFTDTYYDSSGNKKSERKETKAFASATIYVDSETLAEEIKTKLVKLLSK